MSNKLGRRARGLGVFAGTRELMAAVAGLMQADCTRWMRKREEGQFLYAGEAGSEWKLSGRVQ